MPYKTVRISNFRTFARAFGRFYFDESFFIDPTTGSPLIDDDDIDELVEIGRGILSSHPGRGPFIVTNYCYSELVSHGLQRFYERFEMEGLLFLMGSGVRPDGRIHQNVPKIIASWDGKILCLTNEESDLDLTYAAIGAKRECLLRRDRVAFACKQADGMYYEIKEDTGRSSPRPSPRTSPAPVVSPFKYYGASDGKPCATVPEGLLKSIPKLPSKLPESGDYLDTLKHGRIKLIGRLGSDDEEGKGGAGTIFRIEGHPDWIAKIIHSRDQLTKGNEEKIKFEIEHDLHDPRLCWPIDALYSEGCFIGIIYPVIKGMDLRDPPSMNPETDLPPLHDLLEMLAKVCDIFDFLHSNNIVIGDVRLSNFMVGVDSRDRIDINKVYAIDIDSLQIDKYPCLQYTAEYAPPSMRPFMDIDGHLAKPTYRTFETDDYSLAALLMIFLTHFGKDDLHLFVSVRVGSEVAELADARDRGDFPFTLDQETTRKNLGEGKKGYGFLWSHLPKIIKESFVKVFTLKGIVSAKEWASLLRSWARVANSRVLKSKDPDCDIFYFGAKEIDYSKVDVKFVTEEVGEGVGLDIASAIRAGAAKIRFDPSRYLTEAMMALRSSPRFEKSDFRVEIIADYGFAKKVSVTVIK